MAHEPPLPPRVRAASTLAALRRSLAPLLRRIEPVTAGAILLALLYTAGYLGHQELPGNNTAYPLGWWRWWDQSQYIASARALAAQDWRPSSHWYPLGYAILAAPFAHLQRTHLYFLIDLTCLLACYGGFAAFARRVGIGVVWAAAIFVLAVAADWQLFRTWVEPWNTSPTAALLWLLLATVAAHTAAPATSSWRLGAIGVMAAAIPLIRPTDGLAALVCVAAVLLHDGLARRLRWRDLAVLGLGGVVVVAPYAALYLRIYGLHQTDYVRASRQLGFVPGDLGFKAFVLLIEPRAWFGMGQGLFQREPWMVLGLAGIVPALADARSSARGALALLVVAMVSQAALYICYIDLLPTGLWRHQNVHYFKWMVPGLALLAVLWLRSVISGPRRMAAVGLAGVLAVTCLRIVPEPAAPGARSRLAAFRGLGVGWTEGDMTPALALQDARGLLPNITAMRLIPRPDGVDAVALRRAFEPPLGWAAGAAPPGAPLDAIPRLYAARVRLGWPCFLPPYPCGGAPN